MKRPSKDQTDRLSGPRPDDRRRAPLELVGQGALAPIRQGRHCREWWFIAAGSVAGVSIAISEFSALHTEYVGFAAVLAVIAVFVHRRARELRGTGDTRFVYLGGAFVAFPLAYVVALAMAAVIVLALVGGVLWALGSALGLFGRPGRTNRTRRGAASHVNTDGSAKISYATAMEAKQAAREYQRDFGDEMSSYRCANGRHFHIGHRR